VEKTLGPKPGHGANEEPLDQRRKQPRTLVRTSTHDRGAVGTRTRPRLIITQCHERPKKETETGNPRDQERAIQRCWPANYYNTLLPAKGRRGPPGQRVQHWPVFRPPFPLVPVHGPGPSSSRFKLRVGWLIGRRCRILRTTSDLVCWFRRPGYHELSTAFFRILTGTEIMSGAIGGKAKNGVPSNKR